jgi:hypothetical protein
VIVFGWRLVEVEKNLVEVAVVVVKVLVVIAIA